MRKLNVRLLLIVTFAGILLAVGVYFFHRYQIQRQAAVYLVRAKEAREDGRLGEAVGLVRKYVPLRPTDVAGLAEYGSMLAEAGYIDRAYLVYDQVLRRDRQVPHDDIRRKMVDIAVHPNMRRYTDALEHIQVLESRDEPLEVELLVLRAQCLGMLGEFEDAAKAYEDAINDKNCDPKYYKESADLQHRFLDNHEAASDLIDQVVEDHPDKYLSHVIHGTWRLNELQRTLGLSTKEREKRLSPIWEDAMKAVELEPHDPDVIQLLVYSADGEDQFATASAYIRDAIDAYEGNETNPDSEVVYQIAAFLEIKRDDRDAAIAMLERGREHFPESQDILWFLASLQLEEGSFDEAERLSKTLRAMGYAAAPLDYLDARILISHQSREDLDAKQKKDKLDDAVKFLEGIDRDALSSANIRVQQVDYWLGLCYRAQGRHDQAATAFRRSMNNDPTLIPVRLELAASLLDKGDVPEAIYEYKQIANLPDAPLTAAYHWVRLLILTNQKNNVTDQDWQTVERLLDQLEQEAPDLIEIPIFRAEMEFQREQEDIALQLLTEAIDDHPDEAGLKLARINLLTQVQEPEWTRVEELLQEAKEIHGDSVTLRLTEANALATHLESEATPLLEDLADAPDDWSENERSALRLGLAKKHLILGNDDAAKRLADRVSDDQKGNFDALQLLFRLALQNEDEADAELEKVLPKMKDLQGEGPLWQYGKAKQHISRSVKADKDVDKNRELDLAKRHLEAAGALRPLWAEVHWLLGAVLQNQGNQAAAIDKYLEAIDLGGLSPAAIAQAVTLMTQNGRFSEADQVFKRLKQQKQQSPFSAELNRLDAEISLSLNDSERALLLARQAVDNENSAANQLFLGQVAEITQHVPDAEAAYREAIALEPANPDYWMTLIGFLGRNDDLKQAQEVIKEAQESIAADRRAFFSAQCFETLGRPVDAEVEFEQALQESPQDPLLLRSFIEFYLRHRTYTKAEPLLQQLASDDVSADPEAQSWARRNLAMLLTNRGGSKRFEQARKLINKNIDNQSESLEDKRLRARIWATQPRKEHKQEAIQMFEALRTDGWRLSDEDLFLLAQLYINVNDDWIRGNELIQSLLSRNGPRKADYIVTHIKQLRSRDEQTEADIWLNTLQRLAPDAQMTEEQTWESLYHNQRYAELLTSLDPATVEDQDLPDDAKTAALLRKAGGLEYYSRSLRNEKDNAEAQSFAPRFSEAAESVLRKLVAEDPANAHVLANFFALQGDVGQAYEVLNGATESGTISTNQLLVIGRLLIVQQFSPPQLEQLRAIIDAAIDPEAPSIGLLLLLADFQSWHQDTESAEQNYQRVLELDPENLQALNNLAMMIALAQKRTDEAMEFVNRAIDYSDETGSLLDTRGVVRLAAGDIPGAKADLEAANREQETVDRAFHLSQTLLTLGQKSEAEKAFHRSQTLGLKREQLHPLERPIYDKLSVEFDASKTASPSS